MLYTLRFSIQFLFIFSQNCAYSHDLSIELLKICPKFEKILESLLQATNIFHTIICTTFDKICCMIFFLRQNTIHSDLLWISNLSSQLFQDIIHTLFPERMKAHVVTKKQYKTMLPRDTPGCPYPILIFRSISKDWEQTPTMYSSSDSRSNLKPSIFPPIFFIDFDSFRNWDVGMLWNPLTRQSDAKSIIIITIMHTSYIPLRIYVNTVISLYYYIPPTATSHISWWRRQRQSKRQK